MSTLNAFPEFKISLSFKNKASELFKIVDAETAAEAARKCFDSDSIEWTESFIALCLNRANKVVGFYKISQGGVSGTIADPKVIFQFALLSNASSLIIAHNHPSGNTQPSQSDKILTERISQVGKLLEIKLLDHIIITAEGFYSFANDGLL
jgi:DNA repair protein RadC